MQEIMIFEGHEVEVLELDGVVLFNPKHVAECLEIADVNSSIRNFNEKQVIKVTNSKLQSMHFRKLHNTGENFLTESGVYKLVFKSHKPNAEKFTDWIADEVLPSIRKSGFYATNNVMDNINIKNLSPELQAVIQLTQTMARTELEQKRQAEEIQSVKSTVQNMKEELTAPIGDWRSDINDKVRKIAIKSGIDYQDIYTKMYAELETTAHCCLSSLQKRKRERMEKAGNTKDCIKNETTKIAIIEGKPQLKAIFEGIVRRYAVAYCE